VQSFTKGHGTGNDFVVIPDPDGQLTLEPDQVARICDRHTGIGADGILRVVRCESEPEARAHIDDAEWFMDYRNADGSIAQMCGNGARVFVRFLLDQGWAAGEFVIATRAGLHEVREEADGSITVDMGLPAVGPSGCDPMVDVSGRQTPAQAWWMPNPHAVVFVGDLADAGDLLQPPQVNDFGRFPDGQNVEFVVDHSDPTDPERGLAASIRIFERGVGQTQSCGTGACAAALAIRDRHAASEPGSVQITVPGGQLRVTAREDGHIELRGPAVLVARGDFEPDWWKDE